MWARAREAVAAEGDVWGFCCLVGAVSSPVKPVFIAAFLLAPMAKDGSRVFLDCCVFEEFLHLV
jgi:hypothetical protein